ncbi:MAG: 2-(1,2-epoxy-1,2-dihydrophenyl)acetyl-CoA isomerase [Sphingomonadales bacterium]|nr:2-(1,2-epoxy-1,2-dihydrophenyl)acetyl-CoA isomerase [Sphingomonadales bacterium]
MSNYNNITLDILDNVATITLNVPERLNACSLGMADEINDALDRLDGARALVLTGAGKGFCSGADLSSGRDSSISGGQGSYRALTQRYNPLMVKLANLNIPVITAVNGPAAGVGCSIALCCDFTIASENAYFLQAFVNIGLVPDGGASWVLPRLIGKARATQMMMLGEKIAATQALDWGMIYKVTAPDALLDEAKALAQRLASGPTIALGIMRANIRKGLDTDFTSALMQEAEGQRVAGDSSDAFEGAVAFLQKRKAEFKGQ